MITSVRYNTVSQYFDFIISGQSLLSLVTDCQKEYFVADLKLNLYQRPGSNTICH